MGCAVSVRFGTPALLLAAAITACTPAGPAREPARHRQLLIVVDGLRPDYVTAEAMPNLSALGRRGVVFARHHSVYPTVTRVNAASISTGAYPERHGLLGNTVYFPSIDPRRFQDTSDKDALMRIAQAEGNLLTAPTMAESLQAAGRRMLVASSGSPGSAFLNNHTVAGGAILHYAYTLPASLGPDMKILGAPPDPDAVDGSLDRYAVDAFLMVGVPQVDPSVTVIWLSDLDTVAHDRGIGDPVMQATLARVDGEIGRLQDGLRAAGLLDDYDIWVTSDHGFSTYTGAVDLAAILSPFDGSLPDGSPRIVSGGGAVYVRDGDQRTVTAIVRVLQATPGVGAIFTNATAPDSFEGLVAGTLSFDAARWNHDRSAQILFSPDWTDEPNAHGFRGTTTSDGTAGHGSSSPWDVHNTLIAAGPDLRQGITVDVPSANVDFAPTFLELLGIPVPSQMQGRPLVEGLVGRTAEASVQTTGHTSRTPDGTYSVTVSVSTVESGGHTYTYLDGTRVARAQTLPPLR